MDKTLELPVSITTWMFCSVGMLVFNKLAVTVFPLECTLVALQMLVGVLAMVCFCWRYIHIGSRKDVLRWMVAIPFYTGMLLSSVLALKHASMTLVVTFRVISPLATLAIEPISITGNMLLSIVIMIMGVCLYARDLARSDVTGIGWVLLNNFCAIGDRLLQRLMLAKSQSPVDISLTGITLLNNLLGMFPLVVAGFLSHEFAQLPAALASLNSWGIFYVTASCVVGIGISYTGVWVQSLIPATSFLVLVNANKFVIVGFEAFVMHTKKLTTCQLTGACLAIVAGAAYGKAREMAEKQALTSADEKQPLVSSLR